jgi:hypothetical protein
LTCQRLYIKAATVIRIIIVAVIACHDGDSICAKRKLKMAIPPQTIIKAISKNSDVLEFNPVSLFYLFTSIV